MADKKPVINYTSREFSSIKAELLDYARRYYPDTFRDFSVNSFGSLMLDTVSYVGDMLSFYLDYQVNESFLTTANEYDNVLKISKQLGLKADLSPASYGILTFFILIPADVNGAPDFEYAPVLQSQSRFSTQDGRYFTLLEDVDFNDQEQIEVVVGRVDDDTGIPTDYAVRARGQAVSGELAVHDVLVGDYVKFRSVEVPGENITEIISVTDSEGNPYFEVDYLSQNTIYLKIQNTATDRGVVPNIIKPISVPRRFVVTKERERVLLQFGFGTNENASEVLDPSSVLIDQHGKKYISDNSFDPATLIKTDSLGVTPSNTVLRIVYRINTTENTNTGAGTINVIKEPFFLFDNEFELTTAKVNSVEESLEVINEKPFVGANPLPTADELRERAFGVYSMQNRIVTKEDLVTAAYNMPKSLGSVKKAMAYQDTDSFNQRNINLYVISQNENGSLEPTNSTIKSNLKTYISGYKMINDTIDILDAKIINLGISYRIMTFPDVDKFKALQSAKEDLVSFFSNRNGYEIGESFLITDIYGVLKNSSLVLDVIDVDITSKTGVNYSDIDYPISKNKSRDGRKISCPVDTVFEVKFPDADIVGSIV